MIGTDKTLWLKINKLSRSLHADFIPLHRRQMNAARLSWFCIRYISSALLLLFAVLTVASQSRPTQRLPKRRIRPPENFYVIKARRDAQFEALRKELGDRFPGEEGTGFLLYQQWVSDWQKKLYPLGNFLIAHEAMNRIVGGPNEPAPSPQSGSCSGWKELGPLDMPLGTIPGRGVGQVHWIDFDPKNVNNLFTGSAIGGLFYSIDGGDTWKSGGTDFLLPNIGAAHVAVDPNDPTGSTWFLATGDGDGLDAGLPMDGGQNPSHGVYRTTDKGTHWVKLVLSDLHEAWTVNPQPWTYQIKKLVFAPNPLGTIFAATRFGLYKISNANATNLSNVGWSLVPTGVNNSPPNLANNDPFYDIEYKPGDPNTIYASGSTLVRSTDGGVTWSPLPGIPFLPDPDAVRIAMEVTPANPDYLYVVVVAKDPAVCNLIADGVPRSWLYRFDANSGSWTDKGPICNTGSYAPDQRGVHFSRAQSIGVSPIDANLIWIGDRFMAKCTTGGGPGFCSWSTESAFIVHDDIHQMKFAPIDVVNNPNGLTICAAHDGGVSKTVDGGINWTPRSNGLGVAKVERMSTSATDPPLIMAGLFDEGTVFYNGSTWTHVKGGDGLTPIIDHTDPKYMFASSQGVSGVDPMDRSDDKGITWNNNVSLPCPNWSTFAILNSVNTHTVFGACKPEVMRSTNQGGSWLPISNFASAGLGNPEVWKLYTAPSDPDYLYAHLVNGTVGQLLYRTTTANASTPLWTNIPHPSNQWITDIDVDEADPNKFWLTYSGFQPTEKIYYYDPNLPPAQRWLNLTTNLANMSVNSIIHERGSDRLFIGTHLGVYSGNGSAPNWSRVGGTTAGELPYVEADDLEISYVNNKLRAGTRGRGVWEISLDPCLPTVVGPDAIIKDSAADVGNEPNNDSGNVLWASDDIWVRNAPDHQFTYLPIPPRYSHEHQHENPEFSPLPINTPYVYVKVHNRGDQPVTGKVHIYFADASTGLDWQLPDWTEIPLSSTTDVVNLAPGGVWVASLQWTNIPIPQLPVGGHFCLVARFISTQDLIVGEVTGNGIGGNVYNSNNIAWKNLTVVNLLQNRLGVGQLIVRNISPSQSRTRLRFDLAGGSETFLRSGAIEVDLGRKLYKLWQQGGKGGSGVAAIGPTTIAIKQPSAYIDNLSLSSRREHVVTIRFPLRPSRPRQREFTLHVTQINRIKDPKLASKITGGETFLIRDARSRR